MRRHGHLLRAVVWSWALLAAGALPATAQDIPFAFLIKNGWQSTLANQQSRFDVPLTSWAGSGSFAPIVNGQIGVTAGTAYVTAWSRSVPDPFYTPIGPVGAVIALDFGAFRGHLSLFETPSGVQTTIGIIEPQGHVNYGVSGVWVLSDGSSVVGGTANDMVVGGLVRFRSAPATIGTLSIPLTLYFPTVPFPSESNPFNAVIISSQTSLGSFYGFSPYGPARTYRRRDTQWNGFTYDGTLLVMSTGGDNYLAMACTDIATADFMKNCTVSGAGPMLGALTGSFEGSTIGLSSMTMQLKLFLAP